MTARTEEMEAKYQEARRKGDLTPINEEKTIKEWVYWALVVNRFPHDKLNTRHHMVVLKRKCSIWNITLEELCELWYIVLKWADKKYHYGKINFRRLRSIKGIPHIHLCDHKEEYI